MRAEGPLVYKNPFLNKPKSKPVAQHQRRNPTINARQLLKAPVTRATRTSCQERFACKGSLPTAIYDCTECRTLQCELCEALIHGNPKCLFHDRKKINFPSELLICELNCETKNFADVFCNSCNKRLCFACDLLQHKSKSGEHYRVTFELDEFYSLPQGPPSYTGETEECQSWNDQAYLSLIPEEQSPEIEIGNRQNNTDYNSTKTTELNSENQPDSYRDYSTMMSMHTMLDVCSSAEEMSSDLNHISISDKETFKTSFLLVDNQEKLKVPTEDEFINLLGCKPDSRLKVVSKFGNTGAGKSYTLNHTFFNGVEVFKTNDTQVSCTFGVWAAYHEQLGLLVLDTEGMLGITENQSKRSRLLMKILALSDIIIYRTRAERLQNDLFTFLADASKIYLQYFAEGLKATMEKLKLEGSVSSLGPAAIVFQETINTKVLTVSEHGKTPEEQLMASFRECNLMADAYSKIAYVGTQTLTGKTSFSELALSIRNTLDGASIRSTRTPVVIYQLLKALNDKFSGEIDSTVPSTILLEYFTCNEYCQSCNVRCTHSTNHIAEGIAHHVENNCKYQHQFDNKIYLCTKCYKNSKRTLVVPKTCSSDDNAWFGLAMYAWSGFVIECPNCGVIYRSREYWYGNKDPCESCVRTEICHVWPGGLANSELNPNVARRVIDTVSSTLDAVSSVSAKPAKSFTNWMADQFAPSYWKPNYLVTHCRQCKTEFTHLDKKHHCRSCGDGFCADCSSKKRTVPERGWGSTEVRVCDSCFAEGVHDSPSISEDTPVAARMVGEVLQGAIETVATGFSYPIGVLKDSARPSYWVADEDIKNCLICAITFSLKVSLHHCRSCGQGVCNSCSTTMKPVPSRGWDYPVRVCDNCAATTPPALMS